MADRKKLIFKDTSWGDIVLDPDKMAAWNYDGWLSVLTANGFKPMPVKWVPTFIPGKIISGTQGEVVQDIGTGNDSASFFSQFATLETATELARRFGGAIMLIDTALQGGIKTIPPTAYGVQFKNGKILNAGMLASYYIRMPDDMFPDAAKKAVQLLIDAA